MHPEPTSQLFTSFTCEGHGSYKSVTSTFKSTLHGWFSPLLAKPVRGWHVSPLEEKNRLVAWRKNARRSSHFGVRFLGGLGMAGLRKMRSGAKSTADRSGVEDCVRSRWKNCFIRRVAYPCAVSDFAPLEVDNLVDPSFSPETTCASSRFWSSRTAD